MNRRKWTDPSIPLEFLALKLVEEVGEVAKEFTDALVLDEDSENGGEYVGHDNPVKASTIAELRHVEFIAKTLRERLARDTRV